MTYKEKDPLPYFLKENVQTMLKRITGFDKDKLSELRTAKKIGKPHYKIVPTEELRQVFVFGARVKNGVMYYFTPDCTAKILSQQRFCLS